MSRTLAKHLFLIITLIFLLNGCQGVQEAVEPIAESVSPTTAAAEAIPTAVTPVAATPVPSATAAPSATPLPTAEPIVTFTPSPPEIEMVEEGDIVAYAYQPAAEIVSGTVRTLYPGSNNSLWLVTDETAVQWQEGSVVQQLTSFPGRFIGEDAANGRVWAATPDNEIMAWDGSGWLAYGPENGWEPFENSPTYLYLYPGHTDENGRFWLPTIADLRFFDGERWQHFTPADVGLENIVTGSTWFNFLLLPAANGEIWLGVCHVMPPGPYGGQGVRVYRDGVWDSVAGLPDSGCVSAISGDPDGSLWLNIDGSLWHRSDSESEWVTLTPPPPEFGSYASLADIQIDSDGNAWVLAIVCGGASCGTISTLFYIVDGVWTAVPGWEFPALGAVALFMDNAGDLWVTTNRVLYWVTTGSPEVAGQRPILSAAQSKDGRIWFMAEDGAKQPTLFSIR
jgi:hypothetical protein